MGIEQKKVIIIGGGFAGITLAKKIVRNQGFHITLVDRNNYNFFSTAFFTRLQPVF